MANQNDANFLNYLIPGLAKHLFTRSHLIWTPEEIEVYWNDPMNEIYRKHYEYLAQIAIEYLDPILTGQ